MTARRSRMGAPRRPAGLERGESAREPARPPTGQEGSVLLVSLAMLALLTLFALTLTSVCRLERQASANYVLEVEARLAAEAGCALAIDQAKTTVDSDWYSPGGQWWVDGTKQPPGAWSPTNGYVLKTNPFGGRVYYSVECFDAGTRLSVNLNTPNIVTALSALGLGNAAAVNTEALNRGGFRSREELKEFIIAAAGDPVTGFANWLSVRDLLTVHEATTPTTDLTGTNGDLPIEYSGGLRNSAPVNINAAPEKVIEAVLAGLSGRPIIFDDAGSLPGGEWLNASLAGGRGRAHTGASVSIGAAAAADLAARIVAARPFTSWQDLDERVLAAAGVSADHRALILCICRGEAEILGYNPDRELRRGDPRRLFDRGGLDAWTTEFSLGPSGVFEVRAHGWVTDRDDNILAEAYASRVVRCFTSVDYGSQQELDSMASVPDPTRIQSMPELLSPDPVTGYYRLSSEQRVVSGSITAPFRDPADPGGDFALSGPTANKPLREQGYFSPEGVTVWREGWAGTAPGVGPATLRATGVTAANFSQEGSLSFWIKLADDADFGTDEPLVTLTMNETPSYPTAAITAALASYGPPPIIGCTVKVERFKKTLRATWFYWGSNDGAVSRYVYGFMEVYQDINWKAGEWHHVAVSWENSEQDWVAAAAGTPIVSDPSSRITIASTGNVGPSRGLFRFAALEEGSEWFTLEGVTKKSTNYRLGKRASVPLDLDAARIGGFSRGGTGDTVRATGVFTGLQHRYTNALMDDVFLYTGFSPASALLRPRSWRYATSGSVAFTLPVPAGYSAAACAVHGYRPPGTNLSAGSAGQLPGGGVGTTWNVSLIGPGWCTPVLTGFTLYLKHPLEVLEEGEAFLSGEPGTIPAAP